MSANHEYTVLHYVGYDDDGGGIVSIVRSLAATGGFECVLGANLGCMQHRVPPLSLMELPRLAGEKMGALNFWRARAVAVMVRDWLRQDPRRIFHGHSRAGLLVALSLQRMGERRVVVSVHCYGRQRWFYRWAARRMGSRLFWLSPAMRTYYGADGREWQQCIPGGVPVSQVQRAVSAEGRLRLGGIGLLAKWKGWHTVIEAVASLPPEIRTRVTFTHIGGGETDYLGKLQRRVGQCGLAAQIIFRGREPCSDRLLGEIDALVVASENEPFSIAALEALAAGVPVLAANSGGARDIIIEGMNGRLHPTGNVTALAVQFGEWLVRPPAWTAEKIRSTTINIDQVAVQWQQVYASL